MSLLFIFALLILLGIVFMILPLFKPQESLSKKQKIALLLSIFIAFPALTFTTYSLIGSPNLPALPLEQRQEFVVSKMVTLAENHLTKNPDDVRGYEVLAPIYAKLGNAEKLVFVHKNLLRLKGESVETLNNYAESLVRLTGKVTFEAHQLFTKAIAKDAKNTKALYYLALAKEQAGDNEGSLTALKALVSLTSNQEEKAFFNGEISRLEAMPQIKNMVASLEEKLKLEPLNVEGWLRLLRSYKVLNEPAKYEAAKTTALETFKNDSEKLTQIKKFVE